MPAVISPCPVIQFRHIFVFVLDGQKEAPHNGQKIDKN
jgi:hypothetical protein